MPVIGTLSTGLAKALANNSQAAFFSTVREPFWSSSTFVRESEPTEDGVHSAGLDGHETFNRLMVMPYCTGQPGAKFHMKVIGWKKFGSTTDTLWLAHTLATFLCVAGNYYGPDTKGKEPTRGLGPMDYLAGGIMLEKGSLGRGQHAGEICAYGDGPAYLTLDLKGAQKFQFDFAQVDNVLMNAFWSKA